MGAPPVPARATTWGLVAALSLKVRVPVVGPSATGVNVTLTVQLAPAAMPLPQVLVATENGPVMTMLEKLSAILRRFVTVSVWARLAFCTAMVPKFRLL